MESILPDVLPKVFTDNGITYKIHSIDGHIGAITFRIKDVKFEVYDNWFTTIGTGAESRMQHNNASPPGLKRIAEDARMALNRYIQSHYKNKRAAYIEKAQALEAYLNEA